MESESSFSAVLGYEIEPGMTPEEYDRWLEEIHVPDLMANPHLDSMSLHKVVGKVREGQSFYRISVMHFRDEDAYREFLKWRAENPVETERGPDGKTDFRFYLMCETATVSR